MSGEDWGHVSLIDYIEKQFELRDEALRIAQREMNRRLEGMNELRAENAKFVTRELFDRLNDPLTHQANDNSNRVAALEQSQASRGEEAKRADVIRAQAIGISGIVMAVVAVVVAVLRG